MIEQRKEEERGESKERMTKNSIRMGERYGEREKWKRWKNEK